MHAHIAAAALLTGWVATVTVAAAVTTVDTCGVVVTGDAVLAGDLDCSGTGAAAVRIENFGSLDLQGFTLTADQAVLCDTGGECTLRSSGSTGRLVGPATSDEPGLYRSHLGGAGGAVVGPVLVENVSIEGFSHGIAAGGAVVTVRNSVVSQNNKGVWGATVRLEDSSVVDNLNEGLFGATHASLRDSVISGNGTTGVEAESVEMLRSEVNDNGGPGIDGFIAKAYKIRYSSVSGNAQGGILALSTAGRLVLLYSSIQDNGGHGVDGFRSVKLKESSVSGNSGAGIRHDTTLSNVRLRMRVAASTVTGNGTFGVLQFGGDHSLALQRAAVVSGNATNVDCGVTMACADVGSATLPKVSSSATCQTSHVHDSGIPGDSWGVCTND